MNGKFWGSITGVIIMIGLLGGCTRTIAVEDTPTPPSAVEPAFQLPDPVTERPLAEDDADDPFPELEDFPLLWAGNDDPPAERVEPDEPICTIREDWERYTVVRGDTLSQIASRIQTPMKEIIEGNCLQDPGQLTTGQQLYLPKLPAARPSPIAFPEPAYTLVNNYIGYPAGACFDAPFSSSRPVAQGDEAIIERTQAIIKENEYDSRGSLVQEGDVVWILSGPFCYSRDGESPQRAYRQWYVQTSTGAGYVDEYGFSIDGQPQNNLERLSDQPLLEMFSVTPTTIDIDKTFEIEWKANHVQQIIFYINGEPYQLAPQGSMMLSPQDLTLFDQTVNIVAVGVSFNGFEHYLDEQQVVISSTPSLTIQSFSVSPNPAPSNGRVSLSWEIVGEGSGYLRWFPLGEPVNLIEVGPGIGSIAVDLPDIYKSYLFTLDLITETGLTVEDSLTLVTTCPYTFFTVDPEHQAGNCPASEPKAASAAYQQFEGGFMIWEPIEEDGYANILVFYPDGTLSVFSDSFFDDSAPVIDEEPPEGKVAPVRGFGKVWSEIPTVREKLGWGVAAEQPYSMIRQRIDARGQYAVLVGDTYISDPTGRIIWYDGSSQGLIRWSYID